MGLGAALFYLLEPSRGHRRRVLAHDKAFKAARAGRRGVRRLERNLSNRAHGLVARFRSGLSPDVPDDEIVRERVRAAIGRACSHASAIEVVVTDGTVQLSGAVPEDEHGRLLRAVGKVRGVRAVEDTLHHQAHPAGMAELRVSRSAHETPYA
jgi:osmotically-inducible protein OsmY